MSTGQLVGGRSGSTILQSKPYETDVTCRVEQVNGNSRMYNGVFTFLGAPVLGCELDEEADFLLEYGFPEGDLIVLGFSGKIRKVDAWINSADGPLVVLTASFANPLEVKDGDTIPVAGPELERYNQA